MSPIVYANLTIDGQSLLLPQNDLLHIELASNIQPHTENGNGSGLGFVEFDQRQWPVFTLDHDLKSLDTLPERRRLVACIRSAAQPFALACDKVSTLPITSDAIFDALPEIMQHERNPIQALLYHHETLHFLINTNTLSRCLPQGEIEA